jgi:hypothetical protein
MSMRSQTQRTLLLSFIGSVASCGLVGIYCLLLGKIGSLEERILATTATVGGASILGLAAAVPWERRRWRPVGLLGVLGISDACGTIACPFFIASRPSKSARASWRPN